MSKDNPTGYDLVLAARDIEDRLSIAGTDEEIDALLAELVEHGGAVKDKVERYWHVVQRLDAEAAIAKEHRDAWTAMVRRKASEVTACKRRAAFLLESVEGRKVRLDNGLSVYVTERKPSKLSISDESAIPFELMASVPDKDAIKAALKRGAEVPGAMLTGGGPSVTFRRAKGGE